MKSYAFGSSLRFHEGGKVTGYLVRFTDESERDMYGTYFDEDTDFKLDSYPIEGYNLLYHHGLDQRIGIDAIGRISEAKIVREPDEDGERGLWIQAQLNMMNPYVNWIMDADKTARASFGRGLGFSSGALPQSVEYDSNGHVRTWAIIEGSLTLTPADKLNQIDEPYLVRASLEMKKDTNMETMTDIKKPENEIRTMDELKELILTFITTLQDTLNEMQSAGEAQSVEVEPVSDALANAMSDEDTMEEMVRSIYDRVKTDTAMLNRSIAEQYTALDTILKARQDELIDVAIKTAMDARSRRKQTLRAMLQKHAPARFASEGAGSVSLNPNKYERIEMGKNWRYAHLSDAEMLFGVEILKNRSGRPSTATLGEVVSDEYARELTHRIVRGLDKHAPSDSYAIRSALPFRADEISATNISGQGAEWVSQAFSTVLWQSAREQDVIADLMERGMMVLEVPQGSSTLTIPLESSDPQLYARSEANDLDDNNRIAVTGVPTFLGTANTVLTPGTMYSTAGITAQLTEDSVIDAVPQALTQLLLRMNEGLTLLVLNGDTAAGANTNINLIDGTPASSPKAPYYTASDGLRKYPLVTATTYSRNAGNTFSINDYLQTKNILPSNVNMRNDKLLYLMDAKTAIATLALAELATEGIGGRYATITSGVIQNIYGCKVVATGHYPATNSAGKVSGTSSNNSLGSLMLVYAPYVAMGWKRQIKTTVTYDGDSDSYKIYATARVGFKVRGAGAVAMSYNLNVS